MKKLSKILLLVVSLVLVFALTSCEMLEQFGIEIPDFGFGDQSDDTDGGNDGSDDDKEDGDDKISEKEGEILLISNSKALFNVVYTQKSGAPAKRAADNLVKTLRNLKVEVNDAVSDKDASKVVDREIIIGSDALNRGEDCCITAAYLGDDGQAVKIVGKRIIVAGGTPDLTAKAFDVYLKTQMKITSKLKTLETLSVEDDYVYEKLTEYAIASIKINSIPLADYTLVYDISGLSALNYSEIKIRNFASSIFDKSGIVVKEGKLDSVDSYAHSLIIRYVDTYVNGRRDKTHDLEQAGGFRAFVDGKNYVIECCYANVFEDFYTDFLNDSFLLKKGNVVAPTD